MTPNKKIEAMLDSTDHETIYFKQQEQEQLKQLRAKAQKEADDKYRAEHKMHCFRCGTNSLAAVEYEGITIDVCVNEGCGAVHLDPGEMDHLIQSGGGTVAKLRKAVLNIFK